jgi:hypothetical protein
MDPTERTELERIMAALAAGDRAFVVTLIERFGERLAGAVRAIVRDMGRDDILRDPGEIDGLVIDAAFVIADAAGGWRLDGALPWVWAQRAIRSSVAATVGHRTVGHDEDLDAEVNDAPRGVAHPGADDFAAVAHLPEVRLMLDALDTVASERDRAVFLEFRRQKRDGDPSPSHTVAELTGLSSANVRQIVLRVGRRLDQLLVDPHYQPLVGLPFLAA